MKIICWNVRGAGNPRTFRSLHHLMQTKHPQMVFLMETRCGKNMEAVLKQKMEMANCMTVPSRGKSGGLMLFWKEDIQVKILSFSMGHIDSEVTSNGFLWRFTGFYGNPMSELRKDSWVLLKRLHSISNLPWLVGGDFNELLEDSEKLGGAIRSGTLINNFREALDDCSLMSMDFKGDPFTWTNKNTKGPPIWERLDRFCWNMDLQSHFRDSMVEHLDFLASDHRAILISLNMVNQRQKERSNHKPIRFEESWVRFDESRRIVEDVWDSTRKNASGKIRASVSRLAFWNKKRLRGSISEAIEMTKKKIDLLYQSRDPEQLQLIKNLERDLEKLLEEEEIYWKHRARENWLNWGDRNTKWFHHRASYRKRQNQIDGLFDRDGVWHDEENEIARVAVEYFDQLFSSSDPSEEAINRVLDCIPRSVTEDMNEKLLREFTKEEIEFSLRGMHPTKAPGPDGAHASFFQNYWNIVGQDTIEACLDILNGGNSVSNLNDTFIALIPKSNKPQDMSGFRPISLCNVIYKLVAKTLANRLKGVLDSIISPSQSAFVPNRLITDNVILGFECIHAINSKRNGKVGDVALKLDMSKAYDRVEWVFIKSLMSKMGFANRWISLIMDCIETPSYSVLVNRVPRGNITPRRGLRQGDPLSPYLFIICAEGFSAMLQNAEKEGHISGLQVNKHCPAISHLFFADDSLIFVKATQQNCNSLKAILDTYEKASGQLINYNKSVFMTSRNTTNEMNDYIARKFNLEQTETLGRYLGLPSQNAKNKREIFRDMKTRVWNTLQGWKEKIFSSGGKEVLIKAVAQAIPTYTMSCFKLPASLCDELHASYANFWWGSSNSRKRIHWRKWKKLCVSKSNGGLGFRDLNIFNQALLAKQCWRLSRNPQSLAAQVLKGRYFNNTSFLRAKIGSNPSYIWRSLLWGRDLFVKGIRWRIGNGQSVTIDSDPWLPKSDSCKVSSTSNPLKGQYVALLLNDEGKWNEQLIRENFTADDAKIILEIPLAGRQVPDSIIWKETTNGVFTVRSAYYMGLKASQAQDASSSHSTISDQWWKSFWRASVPSKIKIFGWNLFMDIIPSASNLKHKGLDIEPWCSICKKCTETSSHAIWGCSANKNIWNSLFPDANFELQNQWSPADCLLWFFGCQKVNIERILITAWHVWNNRNSWVFNHIRYPVQDSVNKVLGWEEEFMSLSRKPPPLISGSCSHNNTGWVPPTQGCLKLNVDAATDMMSQTGGLGWVLRNHEGHVIMAGCAMVNLCLVKVMEARAVREGLSNVIQTDVHVQVESDSLEVINLILEKTIDLTEVSSLIDEIRVLSVEKSVIGFNHVRRNGNVTAHLLAKEAIQSGITGCWRDCFPNRILSLLC